ncbi:GNAT family N-acetyltransferase [Paenibacillus montanisoli]|uniref:N-acetyltransferase domain-containing protein n=1 Tax=Paenibacillus montanisoli TaxID=2081970 RepID=A0A328UAI2_9BACL|nr:GNAT family N-acetyltransferase [Paenibacillus montanisoli]RAP77274.1 hypothetical protein DL346_01890 [Paenibacillus montanisoli]
MYEIETERLTLKMFDFNRDLDAYSKVMGDKEVGRWLPKGTGYSLEATERLIRYFIEHWNTRGYGTWAIYRKDTDTFLGHCGLNYVADLGETELLYAFGAHARGQGFCTEAAAAAIRCGFSNAGLQSIIALAKPDNAKSIRVMEKLGMTFKDRIVLKGMDLVMYKVLKAAVG